MKMVSVCSKRVRCLWGGSFITLYEILLSESSKSENYMVKFMSTKVAQAKSKTSLNLMSWKMQCPKGLTNHNKLDFRSLKFWIPRSTHYHSTSVVEKKRILPEILIQRRFLVSVVSTNIFFCVKYITHNNHQSKIIL